jgi:Uma2 family endonuclease
VGESEHSDVQTEILFWFRLRKKEWGIRVNGELRTRTSEKRVRVPDVCVRRLDTPREKVLTIPPLVAIEVLSPEDRLARVVLRLKDFLTMGVPNIWLIDPLERQAFTFTKGGLLPFEESRLLVPGTPIYLDLPEIFSALD